MNVMPTGLGPVSRPLVRDFEGSGTIVMRVNSRTEVRSLAGAIAKGMRTRRPVQLAAVGQDACYRAIKALATAHEFLLDEAVVLRTEIVWRLYVIDGQERTGLEFRLEARDV